jgi:hypothetical protein
MKTTLTTLAAVAALIAGISLASAAGMDQGMGSGTPRGKGSGQFCLAGNSGIANCNFASISACQKAAKPGQTCEPNPNSATTGSKE